MSNKFKVTAEQKEHLGMQEISGSQLIYAQIISETEKIRKLMAQRNKAGTSRATKALEELSHLSVLTPQLISHKMDGV